MLSLPPKTLLTYWWNSWIPITITSHVGFSLALHHCHSYSHFSKLLIYCQRVTEVGWEISPTQANNCWSAVFQSLCRCKEQRKNATIQMPIVRTLRGGWLLDCGSDFFKVSFQWVFLFPRDLAPCRGSCWLQWEWERGCPHPEDPKVRGTPHLSLQRPGVG